MMSSFVRSLRPLMAALLTLLCGTLLFAQSTTDGAIGGTVFDAHGAVVAKAKVVIHNNGTNAEKSVTTDESGYYRATNLQPGTYTISINQSGFAPYKAEQVIVQVGSVTEVSPHLGVSATTEVVEVTAEAPQINYTSPEFAPTLNQIAISNLPINGGRWSSFAMLTPSVVSNGSGFGPRLFIRRFVCLGDARRHQQQHEQQGSLHDFSFRFLRLRRSAIHLTTSASSGASRLYAW